MKTMHLVFDIGGTNTRIATSQDLKTLENTKIIPTDKDFETHIQSMSEVVEELRGSEELTAAAGGIAGSLDLHKESLLNSPNLQQWVQRPLKAELENAFNTPVYLENDANLGGLGEAVFGVGQEFNVIAFLTIGTGVGGARIVDKKIDINPNGVEPGHQIIKIDGDDCNCGGKGHLESYISGVNIERLYGEKAENLKDEQVWDEICKNLSVGLNNTIVHWSPEVVILSGSVAQKIPLEKVGLHLSEMLQILTPPQLIKGVLQHEAGLYGALNLLKIL